MKSRFVVPTKHKLRRSLLIRIVWWVVLLLFSVPTITAQGEGLPDQPEILWDTWGVPHIFSPDNAGLFYAFGWAQAHTNGDLILKLYGEARGRAAEYWGAAYAEGDAWVHRVNVAEQAALSYHNLSDEFRSYVDSFAAGFNDYAAAHPERIGDEWEVVLPVQPVDLVAHGIRTLKYLFVAGDWQRVARMWAENALAGARSHAPLQNAPFAFGSNAWAIGPARSASGNAMLVANPHQPWSDWGLWVEAHLVAPGVDQYGAALIGSPILGIAFNRDLGWTHTVNTHDGWDVYELTLTEDGSGYLYDGEEVPFDVRETSYKVRRDDGTVDEIRMSVRSSLHGPVVEQRDDGKALALRVVGDNHPERGYAAAEQWWEMGLATNFDEFQAAVRAIRIPMFTIMYADRDGNIMHLFNELVPVRSSGDWTFWNNMTVEDSSNPAVIPGDTSEYLWTEYHPYEDLPKVINPESGWLQNANEPPWTTTLPLPLNPDDYPAYMLPHPYTWPRPITSMRLLYEDETITFDELVAYKHSTFMELTRLVLDDLIAAARESDVDIVLRAADVLENWDRHADADSVGAVLFTAWAFDYIQPLMFDAFAVPYDVNDPLNTPRGLANPQAAVASLERVARQLELLRALGGGMDAPYGDIFRLRWGNVDLPANGSFDMMGTFRILTFVQDDDLRFRPVHGDSYIAVVEFGDTVRAKVLLSYGNSTQPGSPHMGDQLALFARKELRDAWLTREQIEANLDYQETFER